MSRPLKSHARLFLMRLARWIGSEIVDQRTGESLGRALLVPWRGKVLVVGLDRPVVPVFLPEDKVRHGRQFVGFQTHPTPDFPPEAPRS